MAVGEFFFSAALTAQNSQELHFRSMNSFMQPSLVESLSKTIVIKELHFNYDVHRYVLTCGN